MNRDEFIRLVKDYYRTVLHVRDYASKSMVENAGWEGIMWFVESDKDLREFLHTVSSDSCIDWMVNQYNPIFLEIVLF